MALSPRWMHAGDALPGFPIRAGSAPPLLWQVNPFMLAAWTELCMHLHDEAGRGQAPPLLYAPQRTTPVYGRGTPCGCPEAVRYARMSNCLKCGHGTPCGCPEAARYGAFLALCLILCLLTACSGAAPGHPIIKQTPPPPPPPPATPPLPHPP